MGTPDSTTIPISSHSTGLANIHSSTFLDLSRAAPVLNPNGAGVLQLLQSSGACSVAIVKEQDIKIDGSFRTQTDGHFERRIGLNPSTGGGPSTVEVGGETAVLYKRDVTETFHVHQIKTQPNQLSYTLNGLTINQSSPRITTVHGVETNIRAGLTTETIEMHENSVTTHGGTAWSEQYRGMSMKTFGGACSADVFAGMRSEFVEIIQLNIVLGAGIIVHLFLKVMQLAGGSTGFEEIHCDLIKNGMRALELKIVGFRARCHAVSMRGGAILLGLWRILF